MKQFTSIILQGLNLNLNIGWLEEERLKKQVISIDVVMHFAKPLLACTTDELEDTYCYDVLVGKIKAVAIESKFRLIESLGFKLYQTVKETLPSDARVQIRINKAPPVPNLTSAVFCYGDME